MELKTLKVDKDLHRSIKFAALQEDKTIQQIVREAFELYESRRNANEDENR